MPRLLTSKEADMKKSPLLTATLVILLAGAWPHTLHAQFFKQLVNTVKNTAQNRANSKADNTTNKALDKVDSLGHPINGTSSTGSPAGGGSTSTNALSPGTTASGTPVSGTPSSGSPPDITKALGLMVGGGGVSAADSAAAIKSYMTAGGGSGFFYQYLITTTSKKTVIKDTSSHYLASSGYGRSEMRLPMPGVQTGEMITIGHVNQPTYSISLYPDEKGYSLNVIDTSFINMRENYQVTKVGGETVLGHSCVHVKLTSTTGSGLFKSSSTMDLWTATDVDGYSLYRHLMISSNIKPQMLQALDNAGAGGFIVKMASSGKDYSMTMELITAEQKSFPSSLFVIPAGYTQSQGNMISHMMSGAMQAQKK